VVVGTDEYWELFKRGCETHLPMKLGSYLMDLVRSAGNKASAQRLPFEIDLGFVVECYEAQGGKCARSGIEFNMRHHNNSPIPPFAPAIHLLNHESGYIPGNFSLVCVCVFEVLDPWGEPVLSRLVEAISGTKL
jgi:hypothetical protein